MYINIFVVKLAIAYLASKQSTKYVFYSNMKLRGTSKS